MSTEKSKSANGQTPNASGKGTNQSVSYETYSKVLAQLKKNQTETKELRDVLKKFEDEQKLNSEKKMQEDGNFKQLLEARNKELLEANKQIDELTNKVTGFQQSFVETKKLNALMREIGGTIKHKDYYNLLDTSKIALDSETNEIDSTSLKQYATEVLNNHKELFSFSVGKMPSGAPAGGFGISREQWTELALSNPKEAKLRAKDIID